MSYIYHLMILPSQPGYWQSCQPHSILQIKNRSQWVMTLLLLARTHTHTHRFPCKIVFAVMLQISAVEQPKHCDKELKIWACSKISKKKMGHAWKIAFHGGLFAWEGLHRPTQCCGGFYGQWHPFHLQAVLVLSLLHLRMFSDSQEYALSAAAELLWCRFKWGIKRHTWPHSNTFAALCLVSNWIVIRLVYSFEQRISAKQ